MAHFAEGQNGIFHNAALTAIGAQYGKTPAQVVLRWLGQRQIIAIPKSVHADRLRQNFSIADFTLSDSDLKIIEQMDTGKSLILDITALNEVYRLHNIRFVQ